VKRDRKGLIPPDDYRGLRTGDTWQASDGKTYVVVDVFPNPAKHWCDRGWSCKKCWQVLAVPVKRSERVPL
jgi:hypothetical protein